MVQGRGALPGGPRILCWCACTPRSRWERWKTFNLPATASAYLWLKKDPRILFSVHLCTSMYIYVVKVQRSWENGTVHAFVCWDRMWWDSIPAFRSRSSGKACEVCSLFTREGRPSAQSANEIPSTQYATIFQLPSARAPSHIVKCFLRSTFEDVWRKRAKCKVGLFESSFW